MYIDTMTDSSRPSRCCGGRGLESPASGRACGEPGSAFEDSE
ncbi:MAG TPA: hypothetical protein VLA38_10755 [Steroidobacteraceae bacterium]|nr:hypothetical protein [Steroidobacteraceae bacterium]